MLYKDKFSWDDSETSPGERPDLCMNCSQDWNYHFGWACEDAGEMRFSKLLPQNRYLTPSMVSSITAAGQNIVSELPTREQMLKLSPVIPKPKDISDWRMWAHNREGDCPCGIVRSRCDYHR